MTRKTKKKKLPVPKKKSDVDDECVIPPPPVKHILKSYTLSNSRNARQISEYVEWQARGEKVQHAEKIKTEHPLGRDYECWKEAGRVGVGFTLPTSVVPNVPKLRQTDAVEIAA